MQVTTSPISKRTFAERGSSGDEGTPLLKKQNSSSLPDISNLGRSSFSHMVTKTFEDADFMSEIAPILSGILTPFIQHSIAAAVGALQASIVNPLLDNNEKLAATIQSFIVNDEVLTVTIFFLIEIQRIRIAHAYLMFL